jgi:hypothetical protein
MRIFLTDVKKEREREREEVARKNTPLASVAVCNMKWLQ